MQKPENNPRRALGKGIGALLPTRSPAPPASAPAPPAPAPLPDNQELTLFIDPELIEPNPLQPRRLFHPDRLAELAQSIAANGIIQPLVVRRKPGPASSDHSSPHHSAPRYQLIAGERRWRAAKLAKVATVPVVVRDIPEAHLLEVTLIENIQREDLSPIETAMAFSNMHTELHLNADQIGQRTGKDRTTILNFMRLLQLPVDLQELILEGKLSAGHARCLLKLPNAELQRNVANRAMLGDWSVRQMERTCAKIANPSGPKDVDELKMDPNLKAAILELQSRLGTKVTVKEGARGRGKIEIEYYSSDELTRIYEVIMGEG
jgi:ParB family transcriptional regulator, chromosome partitioning protein